MNEKEQNPSEYYYFDDSGREVVFKRCHTPTPWMNYLSNGTFHAMLSQAAGGPVFYKSPQIWRFTRYRFFHLPTDRPGPYVYIRDTHTGQTWCLSWEPAAVAPDAWESAHGLGYTRFTAEKDGIRAQLRYFVGAEENALIWDVRLENASESLREIRVFAYVEFGMMEFMRELQWQCYNKHQVSVEYDRNLECLVYRYGVEMQPRPSETPLAYLGASRAPDSFDGDRDEFVGAYRSEENPWAVEQGGCTGSQLRGGDPCGALQFNLEMQPGEHQNLSVFLGAALTREDVAGALARLRSAGYVDGSFEKLRGWWDHYLDHFQAEVPDAEAQRQIDTWTPYQAHRNFLFSRNISYYATGTFRGVGFRDTAQDILAQVPFDIEQSKEKVRMLLGEQFQDGHVHHYFFPVEGWPPVTTIHSDDHLWPIWAVWSIVVESGSTEFLAEKIRFVDGGEGTVYEHLVRAVNFTKSNLGPHGFPLMLRSDWNDQLFKVCRKGKGESIWTAMQLGVMLPKLAEMARLTGRGSDADACGELYKIQKEAVNLYGWDGEWYRRAVMDDGRFLGVKEQDQARIWLNTQTWSVMSDMAQGDRGRIAMDTVSEQLDTSLGIKKIHPPITDFPDPADPLTNYNPGTGENGAVFCHANTWAIIAECMLGRGDRAWKYYHQLIPSVAMKNAGAWRYKAEPYVYSSNLFGPDSDKFGLANVSWLTGTAAWMYVAATQYILGIRPTWEGLLVDPCIPASWGAFHVIRQFRGCTYSIHVHNKSGKGRGVRSILVDGTPIEGAVIPAIPGQPRVNVAVEM